MNAYKPMTSEEAMELATQDTMLTPRFYTTDFDALDAIEEREDKLLWDTRIYQDRNKSLTYVCESPVIIEKRAFAIGKVIQAAME